MYFTQFLVLFLIFESIEFSDLRKVTTSRPATTRKPSWIGSKVSRAKNWIDRHRTGTTRSPSDPSWSRKKLDSAKRFFGLGTTTSTTTRRFQSFSTTPGWTTRPYYDFATTLPPPTGFISTTPDPLTTTKKSLFQIAKESKIVAKGVDFVKKDLGIGVVGPKPESKILKYGKKAMEKLLRMRKPAAVGVANVSQSKNISQSNMYYDKNEVHDKLDQTIFLLQSSVQESWNTSEAGTKYKLFEDPLSWEDAQENCRLLGSDLAELDSESRNDYAAELLSNSNSTAAWFGLRTEISTHKSEGFNNFPSNFANGCGFFNETGSWSISDCSLSLPYLCQSFHPEIEIKIE